MKAAFLMLDGLSQVVLTPESAAERAVLEPLHQGGFTVAVHRGEFRATQGGYVREFGSRDRATWQTAADTMLVLRPAETPKPLTDLAAAALRAKLAVQAQDDRFFGDTTQAAEIATLFKLALADIAHDAVLALGAES